MEIITEIYKMRLYIILCLIFVCIGATLTPKSPKHKSETKAADKQKVGPQNHTVFDRNLVVENPSPIDILTNYQAYHKNIERRFNGMVLGYVTPWNNHGYDVAKVFAKKFTHISPVWLQIKRKSEKKYELTGTHDIDMNWITDVKKGNPKVKMVPRVLFDGWNGQEFLMLLTNEAECRALRKMLINACNKWRFDGFVIEVWSQLAGRIKDEMLINLIQQIGSDLLKSNYETILVVPPKRGDEISFTQSHYNKLYNYISGLSLMTYDYSSIHRPGPNAPLNWISESIESVESDSSTREKILMGLNFYGNDYTPSGGGPIVSHEYIKLLRKMKGKLHYDVISGENYFEIKESNGKHVVFYPTLYSIEKRIQLAANSGVGLSIWELGQGLDYFYDLL